MITVDGYHAVRDALRNRDLRQALYDAGGVVMADCILTLHGDAHRRRRRVENRLFRRGTFQRWERDLVPGVIKDAFAPCLAAGRADLIELGYRTTMNLTALIAGVDRPRGTAEETGRLLGYVRKFSEGATLAHSTRDHEAVRAEVRAALDSFDEFFLRPSISRRQALLAALQEGDAAEDDLPRDVLTAVLRHREELGADDDVIRREVAFYLQAGSHSSVNAFTHAMDLIFGWAQSNPGDRARLADPAFRQACVHETLRLHPSSPVALREATTDTRLGGAEIAKGTKVVLDLMKANRDPEVFGPAAGLFDPDRVVPDGVARWGHGFGGGMHACIGTELAGGAPADDGDGVLGTVTLMVSAALDAGARPDPDDPPVRDTRTEREHFARYPVVFGDGR